MSNGDARQLLTAVKAGDLGRTIAFLTDDSREGIDCNFQHPELGTTSLLVAVEAGRLDIVTALIERGNADPNLEADYYSNGSPASLAKNLGFTEVEEYLVAHGGEYSEAADVTAGQPQKPSKCAIL